MSTSPDHDKAVQRARKTLHDAVEAAGLPPFVAMAVLAAADGYAKALRATNDAPLPLSQADDV